MIVIIWRNSSKTYASVRLHFNWFSTVTFKLRLNKEIRTLVFIKMAERLRVDFISEFSDTFCSKFGPKNNFSQRIMITNTLKILSRSEKGSLLLTLLNWRACGWVNSQYLWLSIHNYMVEYLSVAFFRFLRRNKKIYDELSTCRHSVTGLLSNIFFLTERISNYSRIMK